MSFDWEDFSTIADALCTNSDLRALGEARYRTAISRAYYAAFHQAISFAENDTAAFTRGRTGQDHKNVQDYFQASSDRNRRRIATNLARLHDNRKMADYDDTIIGSVQSLAQSSVAVARNIINTLPGL